VKGRASKPLIDFSLPMSKEEAGRIYDLGREATIFVILALAARLVATGPGSVSPLTPSGMVPPFQKAPRDQKKRRKKRGAKPGHAGANRPLPAEITHHEEHPSLERCPDCGSVLGGECERRFRLIEDIPESNPEITEHSIPRSWCSRCAKLVEPPVVDAMPRARIGHRTVVLTSWLHYGLGASLSQILAVFNHHLHFKLTAGWLISAWNRLGEVLRAWYEQIGEQARQAAVLNADETGWRISGQTVWLWCFTAPRLTYYMIDRSRGGPALRKFFRKAFKGVLVTDFWAAYDAIACSYRQTCLPHLLRELRRVDRLESSAPWTIFRKKLGRLLRDAMRLRARKDSLEERDYRSRRERIRERLDELIQEGSESKHARRLIKRLTKHKETLFTFLDHDEVPSDNNRAEREIRPAVVMRKNSLCNQSQNGADLQAIMMTVYRTLKGRGLDPLQTIVAALREYVRTGKLPPLPNPMPPLR